ncbi:MAG: Na+/H+ antiporter subunit C [Candidatus Promineifilaceae bacterium]|nr:Na+/H+ antiporter subunit C [Candidatus Promineifilaceae bacterium]
MEIVLAVAVGVLYGTGLFMMMRRSIVKLIIGLALLGYAANLLIFTVGRLVRANPPLIPLAEGSADPLPQALILTAIVIGFGVQAFAVVLIKRVYQRTGTDDIDKLRATER